MIFFDIVPECPDILSHMHWLTHSRGVPFLSSTRIFFQNVPNLFVAMAQVARELATIVAATTELQASLQMIVDGGVVTTDMTTSLKDVREREAAAKKVLAKIKAHFELWTSG